MVEGCAKAGRPTAHIVRAPFAGRHLGAACVPRIAYTRSNVESRVPSGHGCSPHPSLSLHSFSVSSPSPHTHKPLMTTRATHQQFSIQQHLAARAVARAGQKATRSVRLRSSTSQVADMPEHSGARPHLSVCVAAHDHRRRNRQLDARGACMCAPPSRRNGGNGAGASARARRAGLLSFFVLVYSILVRPRTAGPAKSGHQVCFAVGARCSGAQMGLPAMSGVACPSQQDACGMGCRHQPSQSSPSWPPTLGSLAGMRRTRTASLIRSPLHSESRLRAPRTLLRAEGTAQTW